MIMQKIKCTQKSGSNLLFPVIVVAASAYLFVNTITMLTQGKATMGTSIIFIFMYGAVFVNGLILLLNYFNKSITVSDEEIVVTDHFARKDVWKWEDVKVKQIGERRVQFVNGPKKYILKSGDDNYNSMVMYLKRKKKFEEE